MDQSHTPALMVPLLALLAIIFPLAVTLRTPASRGGSSPQAGYFETQRPGKSSGIQGNQMPPHSAAKLVEDFLHDPTRQGGGWSPEEPRSHYSLDFLIATVPDPINSGLPYMFDSAVDSIQRAFEAGGYGLDRFEMAWSEPQGKGSEDGSNSKGRPELQKESPSYHNEASVMLFRQDPDPGRNLPDGKLFVVFLVGESPTSGLHKAAMTNALLQLGNFFPWGPDPNSLPEELRSMVRPNSKSAIKIMGPTFSGSADSLDFTLRDWLARIKGNLVKLGARPPEIRIVSGTATVIDPKEFSTFEHGKWPVFQAVVPPDAAAMHAILGYIRGLGHGLGYHQVAMLTEGGTAYGQNQEYLPEQNSTLKRSRRKSGVPNAPQPEIINLPFPLHISQLRTASERQRRSQQGSASESIPNPTPAVPLDEGEATQPRETPKSFSSLEVSSAELVLSRLLSTISREGIRTVGILATDIRDTIFLARQINQHCPGTLVFTVNSDLLYSHPDVGGSARGMLVFTPYPLFNLNQVWTPPYSGYLDADHHPRATRLQFSSQDAEGVYNATLALLDRNDLLLDYGSPFAHTPSANPPRAKPQLWLTVVGRGGPMPVEELDWVDTEDYSLSFERTSIPQSPRLDEEGIYTPGSALGFLWLSLGLMGFSVLIILQYHSPAKLGQGEGSNWASRLLGEPVNPSYRSQARLFMLAALVCMFSADLILTSVYLLPSIFAWGAGGSSALSVGRWFVDVVMVAALLSLLAAMAKVARAFWRVRHGKGSLQGVVKLSVLLGCFIVLMLALCLAAAWLWSARANPTQAIATYLRALEFLSGLSPLVPLFCVAAAGFLWAFCSFWRLRMIDGIRPTSREQSGDASVLGVESESFAGVRDLESKVRDRLEKASVFSTGWHILGILVGFLLFVWVYLFISPFVPTYEGLGFYFLFSWGFFLVYFSLTMEFCRLWMVWNAFRNLLQRLALHPMQGAYSRFHKIYPGISRIDLAIPLRPLSVLSFSVNQAEQLLQTALSLQASAALSDSDQQSFGRWVNQAQQLVPKAAHDLSTALEADAKGCWRVAVEKRSQSQEDLGTLAHETAQLLEPSWHASTQAAPASKAPRELQEFIQHGEEFLAGRMVLLISYVLPSLRKLGTFILSGLILMLFSVMFYPFLQKNHFLAFNWVVILSFVGVALLIMLQMERDTILNLLNGTEPGQVTVTRHFTFRILKYVMAPILLLLAAQFPDTIGQIISWFSIAGTH